MHGPKQRLESLDSLRGIAAITVICSHMNLEYFKGGATMPLHNTLLHVFYNGNAAVIFFFVLSGFVLSYKYLTKGTTALQDLSLRSFFIARIFRIYPLFLVVLALTAFCATYIPNNCATIPERVWSSWWFQFQFTWLNFFRQTTLLYSDPFLGDWIGTITRHPYIPQAWSLSIELILSMLVPVLVLIAVNRPRWLVFLTVVLIWVFGIYIYLIHFVMGILLAFYLPAISRYMQSKGKNFTVVLLLLGIFLYSYQYSAAVHFPKVSVLQIILFSENSVNIITGLGVVLIISSVLNSIRLQKVLGAPVMQLLGKVSYGIYLLHTLVMVFVTPYFVHWLNSLGITGTLPVVGSALLITIGTSALIGFVLHHLIEMPFIALGKKLNTLLWRPAKNTETPL